LLTYKWSDCLQVDEFYALLDESAFYGAVKETVCSLLLSILPRPGHKYKKAPESISVTDEPTKLSNPALLLHTLLKCIHEMGRFCCMEVYMYTSVVKYVISIPKVANLMCPQKRQGKK